MSDAIFRFPETFIHLGDEGAALPLEVTERFWPDLAEGRLGVGPGRLVSAMSFEADWSSWEMHPCGEEVVCLLSGAMDFLLEKPEGVQRLALREPGSFVLVPRGTWHTAEVSEPAMALFITAGEGTEHRPV